MRTPEEIIAEIEAAVSEYKGKLASATSPSERAIAAQMLRLKTVAATGEPDSEPDKPAPVEAANDPVPDSWKPGDVRDFWETWDGTFAAIRNFLNLRKAKPAPVEPPMAPVEDSNP